MKKLLLIAFIFLCNYCYPQEFKYEEKVVTGIFEAQGKSKSEIFSAINKWISINYNSSKNVIQMNDIDSGTIIVKGINTVKTKNALKKLYPISIPEFNFYDFSHLIEINIKDNKFRIIYKLQDLISDILLNDKFNFNCVNFNGVEQSTIDNYNKQMDGLLKMGFVGKKKREDFKSDTKSYLEGVNKDIIDSEKLTMLSIEKSVNSSKKDNW